MNVCGKCFFLLHNEMHKKIEEYNDSSHIGKIKEGNGRERGRYNQYNRRLIAQDFFYPRHDQDEEKHHCKKITVSCGRQDCPGRK